jgi:hypothetical protein
MAWTLLFRWAFFLGEFDLINFLFVAEEKYCNNNQYRSEGYSTILDAYKLVYKFHTSPNPTEKVLY